MEKLNKKNVANVLALTALQEGMLFHYLKAPESDLYCEQLCLGITGELDILLFEQAWQAVVQTNEMLRTVFRWNNIDKPVQVVLGEYKHKAAYYDLSSQPPGAREQKLQEIIHEDRSRRFDLSSVPFRLTLCKLEPEKYSLVISNHHILYDGWSNGILLKEFFEAYDILGKGGTPLKKSKTPFARFIRGTLSALKKDTTGREAFWRQYLQGIEGAGLLSLPKGNTGESPSSATAKMCLDRTLTSEINLFLKKHKLTQATFFYLAWGILLEKYNNRGDVVFGTTVSGRPAGLKGIEDMVGLFIETLPLRTRFDRGQAPSALLAQLQLQLREREQYEGTPLTDIKKYCNAAPGEELFESLVVVENYPLDELLSQDNRQSPGTGETREPATPLSIDSVSTWERTNYELVAAIFPGDETVIKFTYDRGTLAPGFIGAMADHFRTVVCRLMESPAEVSEIDILSELERKRLLHDFNDTGKALPANKTISRLFEDQAARTPGNTAAVCLPHRLTYEELNRKANQLAGHLVSKGLRAGGSAAAVMLEPSVEIIVSILAVLKAGGHFLPIDPGNPRDRIGYILEDSGTHLLLSRTVHTGGTTFTHEILDVDDDRWYRGDAGNPGENSGLDDHIYMIYTSGTTGRPKGVLLRQRNMCNYTAWFSRAAGLTAADKTMLTSSFSFDLGYTSIFPSILNGGGLHFIPKDTILSPSGLLTYILENGITYLKMTPSLFNVIVEDGSFSAAMCRSLRLAVLGGEAIIPGDLEKAREVCPHLQFMNHYGPTEATIGCVAQFIDFSRFRQYKAVPVIGRPIHNSRVYILNKYRQLLPVGIPGELCLSGAGIAAGYYKNPGLTAEKFLPDPFFPDSVMYRTGDLARWTADGTVQFLGRIDSQVKLRGFRIELSEIENRLNKHPGLRNCVVITRGEGNDMYLCAYIVPTPPQGDSRGEAPPAEELKRYLTADLPEYMIPSFFVTLEVIPVNLNGKTDRKALPAPDASDSASPYTAPRTQREHKLAEIWGELLGLDKDRIGIDQSFFHLGGHSLKMTGLAGRINKHFKTDLPPAQIFEHPTIREIAAFIRDAEASTLTPAECVEQREHYPLSRGQTRLWFTSQMAGGNESFNMPGHFYIEGELDQRALQGAFELLVSRHESLRTVFLTVAGEPRQKILPKAHPPVQYIDTLNDPSPEETVRRLSLQESHTPFDFKKAPLMRVKVLRLAPLKHLVLVTLHHIIGDGLSEYILFSQFLEAYGAVAGKKESPRIPADIRGTPPIPRVQYKEYVTWEQKQLAGEKTARLRDFWKTYLGGNIAAPALPYDKPPTRVKTYNGKRSAFRLPPELTKRSDELLLQYNVTRYVFFLAIFNIFLAKVCRQDDITVVSGTAGRECPEFEEVVGLFVRGYAIRNRVLPGLSFRDFLTTVRESHLAVTPHTLYPFEKLVEDVSGGSGKRRVLNVHFNLFDAFGITGDHGAGREGAPLLNANEVLRAKDDFSLQILKVSGDLLFSFEYNTDLFNDSTVQWLMTGFEHIARQAIHAPEKEIRRFLLSTGREKELYRFLAADEDALECIYPLNPAQRDLYLDCILNPGGKSHRLLYYNVLHRPVEETAWRETLEPIYQNSPQLRARLLSRGDDGYLGIVKNKAINCRYIDLEGENLNEDDIYERMKELTFDETHGLERELLQFSLVKFSHNLYVQLISAHHIIFDGLSGKTLFEQWHALYGNPAAAVQEAASPEFYTGYNQADVERFDTSDVETYWTAKISEVQKLKSSGSTALEKEFHETRRVVEPRHLEEVHRYCRGQGISTALYFRALYALMIRLYCGAREDFILREIVDGRNKDAKNIMGCFYRTVPMVSAAQAFGPDNDTAGYFQYVRGQKKELGDRQFISIFLQNRLIGEEDIVFYYNFSTFFQLDIPGDDRNLIKVISDTGEAGDGAPGKEIHLRAGASEEGFRLDLSYNKAVFYGHGFLDRLLHVSAQITGGVTRLGDIDVLKPKEKELLLNLANDGDYQYPSSKTLCTLFEDQAAQTPDSTALIFEDRSLTYKELDLQSNHLAHHLRGTLGVRPGTLVGLLLERSPSVVISMLAAMKVGAAYLPIDPRYPGDRISFTVTDSAVTVLLVDDTSPWETGDAGRSVRLAAVPTGGHPRATGRGEEAPLPTVSPSSPAYVIYTSGSTGRPKGVLVEHRNVVRLLFNSGFQFDFNSRDTWTMFHSPCFDFSVWEMYGALLYGGKLVIIPRSQAEDTGIFYQQLDRRAVTVLNQTPSAFYSLVKEEMRRENAPLRLRYVIFGGEALHPANLKDWKARYPKTRLINMFGITETTVHVTFKEITEREIHWNTSNIGRPIPTLSTYITGPGSRLSPFGLAGELCVSGAGVSRGYLNRVELTAEKFLPDPYAAGQRIYRSGDLGRFLEKGELEYLGRIDHQVQVRGFRVELGEIEHRLLQTGGIAEVLVTAREAAGGDLYLCAYLVCTREIDRTLLRRQLSTYLPDYMIPSYFVSLERMPLTPNGKIDRRKLPAPELTAPTASRIPPKTALEKKLAVLWAGVLGMEEEAAGTGDDFFTLGGHSLKAVTLIADIHKALSVKIPLVKLFENPTIGGLARYIEQAAPGGRSLIPAAEKREHYPLSYGQQRLYVLRQIDESGTAYHIPAAMLLEGIPDIKRMETCFRELIRRHESLRTAFIPVDGEPVQVIQDHFSFHIESLEGPPDSQPAESCPGGGLLPAPAVQKEIEAFIRPFDLTRAPLLRVGLITAGKHQHILVTDVHHIVADGASLGILIREFMALYRGETPPEPPLRYRDYSQWQRTAENTARLETQQAYWLRQFSGDIPELHLPLDYPRPASWSFEGGRKTFSVPAAQTRALKELAKKTDVTLFMLLLAHMNVFLGKLSGDETIVTGTPTAGRGHADLKPVIGMFVNTLALKNQPGGTRPFTGFLSGVRERTLEALENQELPFEHLVDLLPLERQTGRNPLFDVFFTFQAAELPEIEIPGMKLTPFQRVRENSQFDFTAAIVEEREQLTVTFEYGARLFKEETILRFTSYFKNLAAAIPEKPGARISQLDIMPPEEKYRVMIGFNQTQMDFPRELTLQRWCWEQAARTPFETALVFEDQSVTYRALDNRSARLAACLKRRGTVPGGIVGIMADNTIHMVMGLLAILKAGAVFLPIDPAAPPERIRLMMADSGLPLLLTDGTVSRRVPGDHHTLDISGGEPYRHAPLPPENVPPHNPAYIIYTSGSTGAPKGVMARHGNIVNQLYLFEKMLYTGGRLKHLLLAPITFDPSVQHIFSPLTYGGRLHLVPKKDKDDATGLLEYIFKHRIDVYDAVPSQMEALLEALGDDRPLSFKYIILAGEVFSKKLFTRIRKFVDVEKLLNIYGPTEATINTTMYSCGPEVPHETVPIGKPLPNYRVLLLDRHLQAVPVGIPGEICIGGTGVAAGYINNPELTHEKFVGIPSGPLNNHLPAPRFYRSGDLARRLPGGDIDFIGRIDNQVKIRGGRVELGEIENVLLKHPAVKEAAVIPRKDGGGDTFLCAYMITAPDNDAQPLAPPPATFMAEALPDYMIPSYFVRMETFPLTPNGKIDRKALPAPVISSGTGYVAPAGRIQQVLVNIWAQVLGLDASAIGVNDDFFRLGGHSLKATTATAKIHRELNVKVPLAELFRTPTVREIAQYIGGAADDTFVFISPVEEKEYYPQSSAQKRLYVMQQMTKDNVNYNLPTVVKLEGRLDRAQLAKAFQELIRRHEIFRTGFERRENELVQRVHPETDFSLVFRDIGGEGPTGVSPSRISALTRGFVQPFDLSRPPLMRAEIVRVEETMHLLLVDMHHIISDGVSMSIFVQDFTALYGNRPLPPLHIQYKDFALWQNAAAGSQRLEKQRTFWRNRFAGHLPLLDLPMDFPRPQVQSSEGHSITFQLDREVTAALRAIAQETESTLFMVLLSLFNILLARLSGLGDIIVGTPTAGRNHLDLQQVMGMFVNMLALRSTPAPEKSFTQFLAEVKEKALKAFEYQDYQFDELVKDLNIQRDTARHPLFSVVFALHNIEVPSLEIPGLTLTPCGKDYHISKFDLIMAGVENGDTLDMSVGYCTKLFKKETVERFINYFHELTATVLKNKECRLEEIKLSQTLLETKADVPDDEYTGFGF